MLSIFNGYDDGFIWWIDLFNIGFTFIYEDYDDELTILIKEIT